ncbi:MAG: arsenate reductase (glutaredoxin) [Gammaproteobacteria bacterium]|nr:arsenate reductase (glutaredoxin) [Gammaproteobacteria bacterium]MYF38404.1 arsenate reductase (glutaredoxin) [Gammaproteobacteria bacterium]
MSKDLQIYFNPNCSKCRSALEIVGSEGTSFEVVLYLDHPLSRDQLEVIIDNLYDPIPDLVRKDRKFSELGLDATDYRTRDSVIDLLLEHPELMQRPLIQKKGKWSIARSQEKVLEILRD